MCFLASNTELHHPTKAQIDNLGYFSLPLSWRGLPRQLFIAHRCVIDEGRHDRRILLHVIRLNAIEYVLIRVVSARIVFNIILNELESGQPYPIKRLMVGTAGV